MKNFTYYLIVFSLFCSFIFSPTRAYADYDERLAFYQRIAEQVQQPDKSTEEDFWEYTTKIIEASEYSATATATSKNSTPNAQFSIEIKNERLTLNIDDSVWYVITRDNVYNNPEVEELGLSADTLYESLLKDNIYLNAAVFYKDSNTCLEMFLRETEAGDLYNLSSLSSSEASSFTAKLLSDLGFGGTVGYSSKVITTPQQYKFIRLEYPDSGFYITEYFTAVNGQGYLLSFQTLAPFIDWEYQEMEKIVDSIAFSSCSALTYKETESGVTFSVPAGWVEAPKKDNWEYIDTKFVSSHDERIAILCMFSDAYEDLNNLQKKLYSRDDVNNSSFTYEDIAEMFGCDAQDISSVSYGGKEYYMAEIFKSDNSYNITIPITLLALCENGYVYMYQFSGHSDSEYFDDFESLVASAKYPSAPEKGTTPVKENASKSQNPFQEFSPLNILVSLILTVVIYSLPIIIYRYAIKKEPVSKKKAKRITIIYAIPAFFVMSLIIFSINGSGAAGGSIILWSYINYRMLIGGKKEANAKTEPIAEQQNLSITDAPVSDTEPNNENSATSGVSKVHVTVSQKKSAPKPSDADRQPIPKIAFCRKCGNKLSEGSRFCNMCGTEVIKE